MTFVSFAEYILGSVCTAGSNLTHSFPSLVNRRGEAVGSYAVGISSTRTNRFAYTIMHSAKE